MGQALRRFRARRSARRGYRRREEVEQPTILIDTEEHRVVLETIAALTADSNLYPRGGILVRVLRATHRRDGISRVRGSATTSALPPANLLWREIPVSSYSHDSDEMRKKITANCSSWMSTSRCSASAKTSQRRADPTTELLTALTGWKGSPTHDWLESRSHR